MWHVFGSSKPKEIFQNSRESGIPRLYTERHISTADYRYWVQFTTLFSSAEDVFSSLKVQDVRKVVEDAPENIVTLVDVLTLHLESLVNDPSFSPLPPSSSGGWNALFTTSATVPKAPDSRDRHQEALNCFRVLSRIIPIIYEAGSLDKCDTDITDLEHSALWSSKTRAMRMRANKNAQKSLVPADPKGIDDTSSTEGQFILTDGDDSLWDPLSDPVLDATESIPSTGHALIMTLMELLFHSGFTMPWTEEQFIESNNSDISRVHFTIWEAGIGSPVDLENTTHEHILRRTEIMRLLLILLSKPMYVTKETLCTSSMQALEFMTCELERPVVLSFLCSLLNTVANYRQAERWKILGADAVRDTYTSLCLEMLCVLLSYQPASKNSNLFLFYARKLYRESDFLFLMNGTGKIFRESMAVTSGAFEMNNGRSTFVKAPEEHVSEMLVVIWTLIRTNSKLCETVTQSPRIAFDMLSWLLYVALSNKCSPATLGQAQLAIFMLQDLSSYKDFAKFLSKPNSIESISIPVHLLRQQGTLALDVLIEGTYLLITGSSGHLTPLYSSILLILYNTSPFWQGISAASASRLEQLLHQLASPKFLLSDPSHPYLLGLFLETLSRVVQYNYSSNVHLVYILVRSAHIIERTHSFKLNSALSMTYFAREHAKNHVKLKDLPPTPSEETYHMNTKSDHENTLSCQTEEGRVEHNGYSKETAESVNGSDKRNMESTENNLGKEEIASQGKDIGKDRAANPENSDKVAKEVAQGEEKDQDMSKTDVPATEVPEQTAFMETETTETPALSSLLSSGPLSKAELDHVALTIGKNGFVPTQEWIDTWLPTINFDVLDPLLEYLVPRVNEFCAADPSVSSGSFAHEQVLAFFLREQSPLHVIPPAPAPQICTFEWTNQSDVWLQSYIWGLIYAVGVTPLAIWLDTRTHLFEVQVEQPAETAAGRAIQSFSTLTSSVLSQMSFFAKKPASANMEPLGADPQTQSL